MPELSIIVPVYNAQNYLYEMVKSILGQSYTDFEILLIDDGSKDNSGIICDEFAQIDNRVSVLHKNNGGVSTARNQGLKIARGNFIAFVDADDVLEPTMYAVLMKDIKTQEADISVCAVAVEKAYQQIREQKVKSGECYEKPLILLIREEFYATSIWNKIFRKGLIEDLCFDEEIKYSEDQLFVTEAFIRASKVTFNKAKLYHYIQRENSLSWQDGDVRIWEGNLLAKNRIYELICKNSTDNTLQRYAFEELGKAVFAMYRFAIKYQKQALYEEIKSKYGEVIKKYLAVATLKPDKKLEYLSYANSFKVASLIHYWPKKIFKGNRK